MTRILSFLDNNFIFKVHYDLFGHMKLGQGVTPHLFTAVKYIKCLQVISFVYHSTLLLVPPPTTSTTPHHTTIGSTTIGKGYY